MVVLYGVAALIGAVVAASAGAISGLDFLSVLGCAFLGAGITPIAAAGLVYMIRS